MHVNAMHEHDRALIDLLHVVATEHDLEACVTTILHTAQRVIGASGAAFRSTVNPALTVTVGDIGTLDVAAVPITSPDFTAMVSLPGVLVCSVLSGERLLGVLWLVRQEASDALQDALSPLLDALVIAVTRAHADANRRQAEQLTRSLLDSLSDPLLVFDADWRLLMMNPAADKLFQSEPGAALQQVLGSEPLVAFAEGRQSLQEWVSDEMTYVPSIQAISGSALEGWLLALRDITRFKRLNRNQSEFVRIVSHDVRSPLTSMRGFADMMGMVGELNEKQQLFIEKVTSGINQITALVDNIQDAGSFDPETGFYELKRSQCDLRAMVQRVVSNQLIPKDKTELTLNVSVADDVPIINADPNMLERAVTNLVDNAVKYTPNEKQVDVNVYTAAENLIVSVRDNGFGISEEDQKLLFQRHMRLVRPEHKRVKGSGLGLFIVRSVAQRHGGDAWVESKLGVGTTFFFNIPLKGANLLVPPSDTSAD